MSPFESLSRAFFPSPVMLTLENAVNSKGYRSQKRLLLFFIYDRCDLLVHLLDRQRLETEPCTPTLDSRGDFVHVVANDAEPNVLRILLDDTAKRSLGSLGHHIRFVQDNELEAFREERARFRKLLDLVAYDVDATLIRRVQLPQRRVR